MTWGPLGAILAVHIGLFAYFSGNVLTIEEKRLIYRTRFGKTRTLPLDQIEKAKLIVGYPQYLDRFRGGGSFIRYVITPKEESGEKPIYIKITLFKRDDAKLIADLLGRGTAQRPFPKSAVGAIMDEYRSG